MSIIGNRIRDLRKLNNLTQLEVSKKLNISNTTLSQYETGQRLPSDDIKIKISDIFNVSVDYLLGKSENKKNPHADNDKEELTADENKLLKNFRELNEEGQYMLISQSEALVASGLYIKNQEPRIHLENEA